MKNNNVKKITDFIYSGIKSECKKNIGIECEHFIVGKSGEAVSFYGENGVEEILKSLSEFYPHKTYSNGHLVGLDDGQLYITLEPAAQIETSIAPFDDLGKIKEIYSIFCQNINFILRGYNYTLVTAGYQPKSKADDLDLIPKDRYALMDSYFVSNGNKPRYMMRGSASVQVNIDYFSEIDFIEKFRLANLLSPMLYLITDNAEYFEGEKCRGFSARSFVWENVDDSRCGFLDLRSFEEYAAWLYSTQPIFIQNNGNDEFCDNKTNEEIFENKELSQDDIKHIMSMVFPNVRVKQFIEIRAGDSMPVDFMLAYACLIKGVFYNSEAVRELIDMFAYVSVDDMKNQIKIIRTNGFNCDYYGYNLKELIVKVFELAESTLTMDERTLIMPLKESALSFLTPKQILRPEVTIL